MGTEPDDCYLISSDVVSNCLTSESFASDFTNTVHRQQEPAHRGRAPVTRVKLGLENGILRHYYRGGKMSAVSRDRFFWTGIKRTRAVTEFRLLEWMTEHDLPVPFPLAARVIRQDIFYTCDLITREIPDSETLAVRLHFQELSAIQWRDIGAAIRAVHNLNVFHSDLNANNILIDGTGKVTVIDFDKCRVRSGNSWKPKNINRLQRSLDKLTHLGIVTRFTPSGWRSLLHGYGE